MVHFTIVLGITGKGKSSFINAMNGSKVAETISKDGNRCTTKINYHNINRDSDTFTFIDTPGLNDKLGDDKHLELIRTEATKPDTRIKCILIVMNLTDERLEKSHQIALEEFMNCFPFHDFWKHVIIIRTHADPSDKKFKYQKEEIEGKLVQSIQNDEELKKFMNERKIAIPTYLKEFYIDSIDYLAKNNNRINTDDNTKTTKKEILNHIAGLDPLFEKITKGEVKTKIENGTKKTIQEIFYTVNGKIIPKKQILKQEPAVPKKAKPIKTEVIHKRTGEIDERCFSTYYEIGKYNKTIYDDGTDWISPEPFETYWE